MAKRLNVKVIGAGGIGSMLLQPLARVLNYGTHLYEFNNVKMSIIDGDQVEFKNFTRQNFNMEHLMANKADVTANTLANEFDNIKIKGEGTYISNENIDELITDGDLVFLCVDNHSTRKLVSDHCETLRNVTLISGGNELTDGNIQVYVRKGSKNITLPLANEFHPEIMNPNDKNPAYAVKKMGCQVVAETTAPQIMITNFAIASAMLNAFHVLMASGNKKPDIYDEAYIDINVNKCRPIKRDKYTTVAVAKPKVVSKVKAKAKSIKKKVKAK